jgi:hypothetical protein
MQTFKTHVIRLDVGDVVFIENKFGQTIRIEVPEPGEDEAEKLLVSSSDVCWINNFQDFVRDSKVNDEFPLEASEVVSEAGIVLGVV